jgi:GH25 family lysozyme M1 (1,4-beta-N-acetylmuramidase)
MRRLAITASVTVVLITAAFGCGPKESTSGASNPPSPSLDTAAITEIVAGEQLTCAATADSAWCWGGNPMLRLDQSGSPARPTVLNEQARAFAIGRHHACALTSSGIVCWGSNLYGQLAADTVPDTCTDRPCSRSPVPVSGPEGITAVTAGGFHTCALTSAGEVWCWGHNELGQLGRAASVGPGRPAPVEGLPEAIAIGAGFLHTCAVLADGSVVCWGDADGGRLGTDPTDTGRKRFHRVDGLAANATAVTAGVEHTCVLLVDGSVACWGGNRFGQLGDGTTTSRTTPGLVADLQAGAVGIAAGDHFTCARLADGSVSCWGWNDMGQLGVGSFNGPEEPGGFSAALTPAPVQSLPGHATSLTADAGHACVVDNGEPFCWGRNELGQLGEGSLNDRPEPVRVGTSPTPPSSDRASVGDRTSATPATGIDISYHSQRIDWKTVADHDHRFAFTLSTAGVDFHDPLFFAHWARMEPIHRGAYHFFVAHDDAAAQARWFIANTPLGPGDLAPVVDVESYGGSPPADIAERLRTFVDLVEEHYDVPPIIYTGPSFWNEHLGEGFGDHTLWIAEYGVDQPAVPTGWSDWALWQDTSNASVPGVEGVVDLNRAHPSFDVASAVIPEHGSAP